MSHQIVAIYLFKLYIKTLLVATKVRNTTLYIAKKPKQS